MYQSVIDLFADTAAAKARAIRNNPFGFLIAAAMAGAYVGIGILLIFSLGQLAEPASRPLVMGVSFGIALTLVIFAGAELFTGHTMVMTIGLFKRTTNMVDLIASWSMTWIGNLAGSVLIAWLFFVGGGGQILREGADLIFNVASAKMNGEPMSLLARGILCNWLVCLAIWTSARAKDDAAKVLLIFWCLFAFIASGYEHSIANMTIFAVALLGEHPDSVSIAGAAHNLLWVSLGNIIAGAVFMAAGYWQANGSAAPKPAASTSAVAAE
jgi:nitrite transporter NirC